MVSGVWVFKSVNTFKIPVHVVSLLLLSVLWAFANIFSRHNYTTPTIQGSMLDSSSSSDYNCHITNSTV